MSSRPSVASRRAFVQKLGVTVVLFIVPAGLAADPPTHVHTGHRRDKLHGAPHRSAQLYAFQDSCC